MRSLFLILLPAAPAFGEDTEKLPLVRECVDELVVVHVIGNNFPRVYFIRNGTILADRLVCESMVWASDGDEFQLAWQDYWTCNRVVTAKAYNLLVLEPYKGETETLEWWDQRRRMTDLKPPN